MRTPVRFPARLSLDQLIERLEADAAFAETICRWQRVPARPARYADFPEWLDARLVAALRQDGVTRLYTHQRAALDAIRARRHTVVVTPTASGKTLCYDLPVLDAVAKDPAARALYLFPTKALAQDQLAALERLAQGLTDVELRTYTYDGDTPPEARAAVRSAGHVVITNPDMLHTGILPHHTKWVRLFEQLRYVVLDELHTYRGVFGSHVANVIRRLRRVCAFYGSDPIFVCTSATIANPDELARRLLGDDVVLVDEDGSPSGEKVIAILNPPVVNASLGIRASALLHARDLAAEFLASGIQTICFARSRMSAELLLTYLRARFPHPQYPADLVRGYRGGYLPTERRAIERGLREGSVRGVVSTNALELGIDIGALDVSILVGYPGTVASTWQQMGRAGRREGLSAAFLVATSAPLDQFIARHPEYVLERSAEAGLVNPDNLHVLVAHLKCGAFELPVSREERFGTEDTPGVLSYLAEQGILHEVEEGGHDGEAVAPAQKRLRYHWSAEAFPAHDVSLRTASQDNVVIVDVSAPRTRVVGELDRFAAPLRVHEGAIYFHEGRQYQVERFDHAEGKAYVRPVDADYHTDADLAVRIRVLDAFAEQDEAAHGEVLVSALPTIYKKIRLYTHENVGWGRIHLPEQELQTTAFWLSVGESAAARITPSQLGPAIAGLGHLLHGIAPLFLMCDPRDLGVASEVRSPHTRRPTVFLYDAVPGGVGFAERLFRIRALLLERAEEHVAACPCDDGCPSCVWPASALGVDVKRAARALLAAL